MLPDFYVLDQRCQVPFAFDLADKTHLSTRKLCSGGKFAFYILLNAILLSGSR